MPELKSGGSSRELAFALTRIASKTGEPFGPQVGSLEGVVLQIRATEIKAVALLMYGPFWQLPDAVASLNLTLMALPEGAGALLGSVVFVRGDWNPQNCPVSAVLNPEFTTA